VWRKDGPERQRDPDAEVDILAAAREFLATLKNPDAWRAELPAWALERDLTAAGVDALRIACVRLRAFHAAELDADNVRRRRRR
jgi:hypothetical protein